MKAGKLLLISDTRSIYIIENEDGSLISLEGVMRYRNIGAFAIEVINEDQVTVDEKGVADVGNLFHFPIVWLDIDHMKLMDLVSKGIIKLS